MVINLNDNLERGLEEVRIVMSRWQNDDASEIMGRDNWKDALGEMAIRHFIEEICIRPYSIGVSHFRHLIDLEGLPFDNAAFDGVLNTIQDEENKNLIDIADDLLITKYHHELKKLS